ncbi:MAG: alpha/beta hydrolase [Acidobacteriota bacterium]|nr:alpha/beta hydrolase [Acidobacteriota bacterium]
MDYLVSIPCLMMAPVAAGLIYQRLGSLFDRLRYTTQGRWVDIGDGQRLYLLEKGSGDATVIFEAGIAATNLNWCHIQDKISQVAATVSYDRGGLGWSSPCRTVRTPGNIASELHRLILHAGLKPPFILVGHSFGGLVMRKFALLYPEGVTSVLLVDPMRCEEWPPLDPGKQAAIDRGVRLSSFAIPIARFGLARLAVTSLLCRSGRIADRLAGAAGDGGKHVLGRIKGEVSKMPQEVWPAIAAHWSRPSYYAGMRSHVAAVPDTVREMQDAEPIRGIPVVLLTPGKSSPLSNDCLQRIGDTVTQVIAPESAHWIHLDEPELVIQSIREMVVAAKEAMPPIEAATTGVSITSTVAAATLTPVPSGAAVSAG